VLDRQVTHMTRLIDDLLDVTRIAQGKILLRREVFDLSALVRAVSADLRPSLEAAELSFEVRVPNRPVWTGGDPVRMSQVLGNILQNAAKFTDPGGRVDVVLEEVGGMANVVIADTGIGMTPETVASAFDFFSQSESSRDRSRGGLGLGLALARGLVELHGGRVRAASDGPGRGSRFTVQLPSEKRSEKPAADPPHATAAPRPMRILIVEDNPDMADSLSILLRLEGHDVEAARSGQAGVELARRMQPEVVLCDLGLPGGTDGYAVSRKLRADPGTGGAYLVALSGYADEDSRARATEAGFDHHLSKPVSLDTIKRILGSVSTR
jgi:two-component system, sensor histidine kinase